MAGFSNITSDESIVYADNVSFDGTERGGKVTTDGQLLIGSTTAPHIRKATLSSSGGTVTITNGNGTINLEAGSTTPTTFNADSGSASPSLNIIQLMGGTNGIDTLASGNTVTFNFDVSEQPTIPTSFPTPSGTATPALNALTFANGSGISISGSSSTVTIAVNGSAVGQTITGDSGGALSPTAGNWNLLGSGSITTSGSVSTLTTQLTGLTNHNVLIGAGTATITKVAPSATSGVPLISQGAASDPLFGTAVVAGGGTGAVTLTNHGVLIGQATSAIVATAAGAAGQVLQSGGASADPAYSTATYPAVATGTGKVLIADGTNWVASTPTFPNASATTRKIIVSDGTNWVASTETYAVPGTSGNLLTSNGTNWTSAAPATNGTVTSVSGTANQVAVATGTTTPVISLIGPYTPATYTAHGVLIGEGTSSIVALAAGSAGQVLQSGGASADPTYSTATFPSTATSTGTILRADGTNWVATTATYPATTTINQVLYSSANNVVGGITAANNGTMISSATGVPSWLANGTTGQVLTATTSSPPSWTTISTGGGILSSGAITLTSAQIKALHGTPIEIIPAQGAGKVIGIVHAYAKFNYGGTNVFVAGASQNVNLYYGAGTASITSVSGSLINNATLVSSSTQYSIGDIANSNGVFPIYKTTAIENVNVSAYNSVATEISGNAANDNTITIFVLYIVLTL